MRTLARRIIAFTAAAALVVLLPALVFAWGDVGHRIVGEAAALRLPNAAPAFLRDAAKPQAEKLTARQREVLQLLAEGKSMKEVAGILNVTARTVAFHKYRMMEQLKIKTNAELIQYAIRNHVV